MPHACHPWNREPLGDGRTRCKACGLETAANHYEPCGVQDPTPRGCGDRLAELLSTIGVTEERAAGWLDRLGFVTHRGGDCGCDCRSRREWLNRFCRQVVPWLRAEFIG